MNRTKLQLTIFPHCIRMWVKNQYQLGLRGLNFLYTGFVFWKKHKNIFCFLSILNTKMVVYLTYFHFDRGMIEHNPHVYYIVNAIAVFTRV